jgi:hypothetical protein
MKGRQKEGEEMEEENRSIKRRRWWRTCIGMRKGKTKKGDTRKESKRPAFRSDNDRSVMNGSRDVWN